MTNSLDYDITDEDEEFYEWRKTAQEHGLLHDATLAYYLSDSKHLYTIGVNGELETAPIFTYRKWLGVDADIEAPLSGVSETPVRNEYDDDVIRQMVEAIGYTDGETTGTAEDYVWNGPVYAVTSATTDTMEFGLTESDYYTVKNSAVQLKDELYRSLYERGVDPDAPYLDVVEHINDIETPLRDEYYQTFKQVLEFEDGPRLAGGSAVTVFNTGDDYVIPVATRSSKVSESSGWKNPIPAGVLQPPSESDQDGGSILRDHLLDEFEGTFLTDGNSDDGIADLKDVLQGGSGELVYTASGIDCKQTYVQFYGMLFVDDPEYYETFIEGEDLGNWETENVELVSVSDADALTTLLDRHVMNPYNLVGFAEALFALRDEYGVDIAVDITRT